MKTMLRRHSGNPFYWEVNGKTVLLLGGSREDNLFQIDDLEDHLQRLAGAGGNYIRCTMSSRDPGDVWPFHQESESGHYDLSRIEGPYWDRLAKLLALTDELGIIVQIELWDRFDFARQPWDINPFNPRNHEYLPGVSDVLPDRIDTHPGENENPFFRSTPTLENLQTLRGVQERLVTRVLEETLPYDHVLYCIDNETCADEAWASFWADFVKDWAQANRPARPIHVTEMWDPHDLGDPMHRRTWAHPERYDFVDVSQGNHQHGLAHWERIVAFRDQLIEYDVVRPMTMVKIYGSNRYKYGTNRDAIERFWRSLLAGVSAVRFHRPAEGLSLSDLAVTCIRGARLVEERLDFADLQPRIDLLERRSHNEAYCSVGRNHVLVFFTDGGEVYLSADRSGDALDTGWNRGNDTIRVSWFDVRACEWDDTQTVSIQTDASSGLQNTFALITPRDSGYWIAVIDS